MEISLAGKVAIVTGGSKGIGRGIATLFADIGAQVMITSRKADVLAETASQIGKGVEYFAANSGDPEGIAACVAATVKRFGRVDVLVNNAATSPYQGPLVDCDLPRFDKTWDVNTRGAMVWIQECWNANMSEHGGAVVNISSGAGTKYGTAAGPYGLSKAGLDYITKHFALELAPKVRVNAICPGLIPTDMASTISDSPLATTGAKRIPPLGRLGAPQDIANMTAFLASDLASWVTANVIAVDGGGAHYDYARGPNFPKPKHWSPLDEGDSASVNT